MSEMGKCNAVSSTATSTASDSSMDSEYTGSRVALPHHNSTLWSKQRTLLQRIVQSANDVVTQSNDKNNNSSSLSGLAVHDSATLLSLFYDVANVHYRDNGMCKSFAIYLKQQGECAALQRTAVAM